MRLTELLSVNRVLVRGRDGRASPSSLSKRDAIDVLAELLCEGAGVPRDEVGEVLAEREALQSTGIGDGVAIPHGALANLDKQWAALLIVPEGMEFEAIDGTKVYLLFAVVGPKRATGEHLKTLARISRLLRNKAFRDQLISAQSGKAAYDLLVAEETDRQ
jgi:PTS system nitrogen regulatory IIA component